MRPSHHGVVASAARSLARATLVALALMVLPAIALAVTGNGKLQIHHVNVGQGDGILLISPLGETALFDDGTYTNCTGIKNYLQGLGITSVKYHFLTHYHADHLGCIDDLAAIGITVGTAGYDRGGSYSSASYTAYVNTLGAKRTTIAKNQVITLDAGAATPVTVRCVDLNGAGVYSGTDENALSTVYKVTYGAFDEALGGDLSGGSGVDVETTVGPEMGDVEVYKVHHHGSATSSMDNWLTAITAEVGVVTVGNGNSYGHPTSAALTRMHNHGLKTYWTETGAGVAPLAGSDYVASGAVIVQADPGVGASYTVTAGAVTHTYTNGGGGGGTLTDTKVASAVSMLQGSVTSGSVTNLAANDASRMTVTSAKVGTTFRTDWYGSMTVAHPPTSLTVTVDGNYSVSRTQTLYLYNWTTSAWVSINSGTVGTGDVTRTYTTTSPAAYISGTGDVRVRVQANTRSTSYTHRADYVAISYQYLSGTQLVAWTGDGTPAPALETPAPLAVEEIALTASPNPAAHTARLGFTMPRSGMVRLAIYDLQGRHLATPFDGLAAAGRNAAEWRLTDAQGQRVAPGMYFARISGLGMSKVTRLVVTAD